MATAALWVIVPDADAATRSFYVDCKAGSNSNSGTSASNAWSSLSAVSSHQFGAGDQINLAKGCSFSGGMTINGSGTNAARIVVTSYGSGAVPVISSPKGAGIEVNGSYVTVQGLKVSDVAQDGVMIQGPNAIVRDVEIASAGGGVETFATGTLIDNVRAHDLKMVVNTQGGDDDYGAVGFIVQAANAEIKNSSCVNCQASSYDYQIDGGFVEVFNKGDNLYVHDNLAKNTNGFTEIGGSGGSSANNMKFQNNTIIDSGNLINIHTSGSYQLATSNLTFSNNTVYQSKKPFQSMFYDAGVATVTNNIFASAVALDSGGAPGKHTNNVYWSANGSKTLGYSLSTGESWGDPQFVNAAGGDFRLKSGSPAAGRGAVVGSLAAQSAKATTSSTSAKSPAAVKLQPLSPLVKVWQPQN